MAERVDSGQRITTVMKKIAKQEVQLDISGEERLVMRALAEAVVCTTATLEVQAEVLFGSQLPRRYNLMTRGLWQTVPKERPTMLPLKGQEVELVEAFSLSQTQLLVTATSRLKVEMAPLVEVVVAQVVA